MGSSADGEISRAQLALLRRSGAPALCRDLHDAGMSVPLLILLHSIALQERGAGARPDSAGQQLSLLESCEGHPGNRSAGEYLWRAEYQVRRRDVRALSAPRPGDLRSTH